MDQQNDLFDSNQRVLVTFNPRKSLEEELQKIRDLCISKDVEYLCRLTQEGIVVSLKDPRDSIDKLVGNYDAFSIQEFKGISLQTLNIMTLPASQDISEDVIKALHELRNLQNQEDCY
jgi:hypothetical protein